MSEYIIGAVLGIGCVFGVWIFYRILKACIIPKEFFNEKEKEV